MCRAKAEGVLRDVVFLVKVISAPAPALTARKSNHLHTSVVPMRLTHGGDLYAVLGHHLAPAPLIPCVMSRTIRIRRVRAAKSQAARVEGREEGVGVELGECKGRDHVQVVVLVNEEEDELCDSRCGRYQARLDCHADELGDHAVGLAESCRGARKLKPGNIRKRKRRVLRRTYESDHRYGDDKITEC